MGFLMIGRAFFVASDLASVALFVGKLALVFGLAALLLAFPGWRNRGHAIHKSFWARLLELLVLYGLIDRTSVVSGKSVSVRVDLGGRRSIKKKRQKRKMIKIRIH